jgi:hypothetical protein
LRRTTLKPCSSSSSVCDAGTAVSTLIRGVRTSWKGFVHDILHPFFVPLPPCRHRNAHEIHRELQPTPNAAQREERSVLRPAPRCPWWTYIWSVRTALKVGPDARVPVGHDRLRVAVSVGTRVLHFLHPNGTISILAHPPKAGQRPALLLQVRAQ